MRSFKKDRPRNMEHLKADLKRGVLRTAMEATIAANKMIPQPASVATVRRSRWDARMAAKMCAKRPALKREHIRARRQFVKKYKDLDAG